MVPQRHGAKRQSTWYCGIPSHRCTPSANTPAPESEVCVETVEAYELWNGFEASPMRLAALAAAARRAAVASPTGMHRDALSAM